MNKKIIQYRKQLKLINLYDKKIRNTKYSTKYNNLNILFNLFKNKNILRSCVQLEKSLILHLLFLKMMREVYLIFICLLLI